MANGQNTQAAFSLGGALRTVLPTSVNNSIEDGITLAKKAGISSPTADPPSAPPTPLQLAKDTSLPAPSSIMAKLGAFVKTPMGMILGVLVVGFVVLKLVKRRGKK